MKKASGFVPSKYVFLSEGSLLYGFERLGRDYLLGVDTDRLLAPFYEVRGLHSPSGKKRYGGWERLSANNWEPSPESFTLAGHSLGHYLSALAGYCAFEGRESELYERADYILESLCDIVRLTNSAYLGAIDEDCFKRLFDGDSEHWADGYWVPWYNLHKLFKGLYDVYCALGDERALGLLLGFADWAYDGLSRLDENQLKNMRRVEYGGMNEIFACLYSLTGSEKYREASLFFCDRELLGFLERGEDRLEGLHANTQIPKVAGFAALYEADREGFEEMKTASRFFFDTVRKSHSYAISGNSVAEHFESPDRETLTKKTCESCNSYNMLRLCEYLFRFSQKASIFDFYESALYNHILSSCEKSGGEKLYFVSLLPGHHKTYEKKYASWWCCTGTGMENPSRLRNNIFYFENGSLYFNLYTSCRLETPEISLSVDTDFPFSEEVAITLLKPVKGTTLKLRVPEYCKGAYLEYRGNRYYPEEGYISVKADFIKGERLSLFLPMTLKSFSSRDGGYIYFKHGPVTLAASLGKIKQGEIPEYTDNELLIDDTAASVPKIITGNKKPEEIIELKSKKELLFKIPKSSLSFGEDLFLKPFFMTEHEFYSVYFKAE